MIEEKLKQAETLVARGQLTNAASLLEDLRNIEPTNPWPTAKLVEIATIMNDWQGADDLIRGFEDQAGAGSEILAQTMMDRQALRAFGSVARGVGWTFSTVQNITALRRCGFVSMVKNEADIFEHNLNHHYDLGFRNFCIIDNNSSDGTSDIINNFRKKKTDIFMLYIVDPGLRHYQAKKMAMYSDAFMAATRMEDIEIDWLFYIDGDEFIVPVETIDINGNNVKSEENLASVLADKEKQVLVFNWIHGVSEEVLDISPVNVSPFQAYNHFQRVLRPIVSKVALRPGLRPTQGNHFVEPPMPRYDNYVSMAAHGWFLFHCPQRSVDQYRRKIIQGARANIDVPGLETFAGHWKAHYKNYQEHGDVVFKQILTNFANSMKKV